jgi:hypothetical protein
MLHKDVLHYIDKMLRMVCESEKPFAGKTIILSGDFKQLTPVVPGTNFIGQLNASIKMDPLFKMFRPLKYIPYVFVLTILEFTD